MPPLDRARILAFRLSSQNLTERLGRRSLVRAAAACGIQETPLGSAAAALSARVSGLTPAVMDRAFTRDRTVVQIWSFRGAPYVVPARDLDVFTAGAMPVDRASFNVFLGGWAPAIERAGLDPFELLDRMATATRSLLDGRRLDVNELRDALLRRVRSLSRIKRPREARHDMPEPLYRALGLTGGACIVEGRGTDAVLARTDQWLSAQSSRLAPEAARAELVRRFLRCYGPSTPQRFAEWTARSPRDARAAFDLIADELVEVRLPEGPSWHLVSDRKALASPPAPSGVRLLPVQDPYLQQRDRATLLEDDRARRKLWQPVRGPGGVLVDGNVVGTWRARTARDRLMVTVEPFDRLPRGARRAIEDEAEQLAPLRGCRVAEVAVAS
ncbi:MAG TPA: winged helix DNA-binding domain-containing protein [Actinomycetota bacterium]|nr:winged helix DNA-binding domain-containing protein [Actinomycetota bacterium]